LYTIGPLTEVNMVLFQRNNRFNVTLILAEPNWGGGDYQLRSALAAKHIWVAVITRWGILDSPPPVRDCIEETELVKKSGEGKNFHLKKVLNSNLIPKKIISLNIYRRNRFPDMRTCLNRSIDNVIIYFLLPSFISCRYF